MAKKDKNKENEAGAVVETTEEAEVQEETKAADDAEDKDVAQAEEDSEEKIVFVEDPTFEIEESGECAYEVKVSVPVVNEEKQAGELFTELQEGAELPGFRKGRAPRKLIERKFHKGVKKEVASKLVGAAFEKLVADNDMNPLGYPDVDGLEKEDERKDDEPLTFTLKFEVAPKVELGDYKGIKAVRPVVEIQDDEVKDTIKQMREAQSDYETLEKGKAKKDDQLVIDFEGKIDGEVFDGSSATDYPYILGSKRFFPEFEKVMKGASTSDELACTVKFPDDYGNEEVSGKEAEFVINIKEIKRRVVPKLTKEFAKKCNFESVDDMREKVAQRLQDGANTQTDSLVEDRLLSAVIEKSNFQVPQSMLKNIAEDIYQQELRRLMATRVPANQISEREEEIRKMANERGLDNIKRMVTLRKIGAAENIEVTAEDFEKEAASIVERTGAELQAVANYLAQDDQRSSYENRIYVSKTLAALASHAKITEKKMTSDELKKELEEESKGD